MRLPASCYPPDGSPIGSTQPPGGSGHPPATFAYPNGDWDARAERLLATLGYATAFLFDHRVSPRRPDHRLRISRVRVNSDTGLDRFAAIVSGLHPAVHHVRGGA